MKDALPFGWGLAAVGTTVAKDFGKRDGGIFHGVVKAYDPGGMGEVDLYRIEYADGDKEDMDKHEFQAAHELANDIHLKELGTKKLAAKKQRPKRQNTRRPPTKKINKEKAAMETTTIKGGRKKKKEGAFFRSSLKKTCTSFW
jgi:hypothetical protein